MYSYHDRALARCAAICAECKDSVSSSTGDLHAGIEQRHANSALLSNQHLKGSQQDQACWQTAGVKQLT